MSHVIAGSCKNESKWTVKQKMVEKKAIGYTCEVGKFMKEACNDHIRNSCEALHLLN